MDAGVTIGLFRSCFPEFVTLSRNRVDTPSAICYTHHATKQPALNSGGFASRKSLDAQLGPEARVALGFCDGLFGVHRFLLSAIGFLADLCRSSTDMLCAHLRIACDSNVATCLRAPRFS